MLSHFFILSPRGDTIISKDYRGDSPQGAAEIFFRRVKFGGAKGTPPIFLIGEVTCPSRATRVSATRTEGQPVVSSRLVQLVALRHTLKDGQQTKLPDQVRLGEEGGTYFCLQHAVQRLSLDHCRAPEQSHQGLQGLLRRAERGGHPQEFYSHLRAPGRDPGFWLSPAGHLHGEHEDLHLQRAGARRRAEGARAVAVGEDNTELERPQAHRRRRRWSARPAAGRPE
mmetsp:Transcript_13229/g.39397  ORF Transcript_13229/g.39397 Transcript_13229/m.39397 type:complete len:226 (+) Transcript_13229:109-786(+)